MNDVIQHLQQELERKIIAAFDGVPFPGPDHRSLSQAEAWDNHQQIDQSQDFKGRWQDIPIEDFKDNQWAISHLDAHGFVYYLPALMVAIIKGEDVGSLNKENLLTNLCSDTNSPQLAQASPQQLEVVKEFIEFCNLLEDSKRW